MIHRTQVTTSAAVGANGSAVATGTTEDAVHGTVLSVHYQRTAVPASTTNVVLREAYKSPAKTVHTVTNLDADGWHPVRTTLVDQNDNPLVGPVDYIDVTDQLLLSITGANTGSIVRATIEWDDGKD